MLLEAVLEGFHGSVEAGISHSVLSAQNHGLPGGVVLGLASQTLEFSRGEFTQGVRLGRNQQQRALGQLPTNHGINQVSIVTGSNIRTVQVGGNLGGVAPQVSALGQVVGQQSSGLVAGQPCMQQQLHPKPS